MWVCLCHLFFLIARPARRLNYTIVENFHKCNDCHKNYRMIRGESQSDSSGHREVAVLPRCGELRLVQEMALPAVSTILVRSLLLSKLYWTLPPLLQ